MAAPALGSYNRAPAAAESRPGRHSRDDKSDCLSLNNSLKSPARPAAPRHAPV